MKPGFTTTLQQSLRLLKAYAKEVVIITFLNVVLAYVASSLITFLFANIDKIIASFLSFIFIIPLFFTLDTSIITIFMVNKDSGNNLKLPKLAEYIVNRLVPVMLTMLLYELIVVLGFLLFVIPSVIFFLTYSQAVNFALIDGDGPFNALKRSARVTKNNLMQLFGLLTLFGILYLIISLPSYFVPIPTFVHTLITAFIANIAMIVNYVIWKTLKQSPDSRVQDTHIKDSTSKKIALSVLAVLVSFLVSAIISVFLNRVNVSTDYVMQRDPRPIIFLLTAVFSGAMIFYVWKIKNR